jgi:uncharacterized RDD family membrane protein YckC
MVDERSAKDPRSLAGKHRRFQQRVAAMFLVSAAVVGIWILVGPDPENPIAALAVLLFVELPLFVILALIGMNALLRAATGPRKRRR